MFIDYFNEKYYNKLAHRKDSFKKIFELLEFKSKNFYVIIETGCVRNRNNFAGDGMSTLLFDEFVNFYDGIVISVDKNKNHCDLANSMTSEKTKVYNSDSIPLLWNLNINYDIDLVYLDSYDIDFNKPHPSMLHHLKEFCAILPKLKPGCIIAIDDNKDNCGKGYYIKEFMQNINKKLLVDDYQLVYIL